MARSKMPYTPEQQAVIDAPGGNILVSAAAGSGKTAVMTERIIQRIAESQISLDQTLVLTFTNASAEEMGKRIQKKLRSLAEDLASEGETEKLALVQEQLVRLPRAHISTIHSFCLWLIRNFPQEVRDGEEVLLEADFSTIDAEAADQMRAEALATVLDSVYTEAEKSPDDYRAFMHLVDNYSNLKSDQMLRNLILKLHDTLRSFPDYEESAQKMLESLAMHCQDFESSPHIDYLYSGLRLRINHAMHGLAELESLLADPDIRMVADQDKNELYLDEQRAIVATIRQIERELSQWERARDPGLWDRVFRLKNQIEWGTLRRASVKAGKELKYSDALKNRYIDLRSEYLSDVLYYLATGPESLKDTCRFSPRKIWITDAEGISEGLRFTFPLIDVLISLVLQVDEEYAFQKRKRKRIDFNDYEHFALRILRSDYGESFWREQFREVFIDEYQDTSGIQEAILKEICPDRLFMVGDVKQSIYRFRHARPETFLAKKALYEAGHGGSYFDLNKNFRSEAGILQAINEVFQRVMSVDLCAIDYRKDHEMVPNEKRPPELNRLSGRVEFWLQESDSDSTASHLAAEDLDRLEGQLLRNHDYYTVREWLAGGDGKYRQYFEIGKEILRLHLSEGVPLNQIAVMGRVNHTCKTASKVFTQMGIPTNLEERADLSSDYILQNQYALLQTLDNARQDIPLATVMLNNLLRNPFSDSDLAKIRLRQKIASAKSENLLDAVLLVAEGDGDLAAKCKQFLSWLEKWRDRSHQISVAELLEEIWFEGDYQEKLIRHQGPNGPLVLEEFRDWIQAIEEGGREDLFSVVRFLEEAQKLEQAPAGEMDLAGEGVHVLTFHKSKGLEFPYVFLINLHSDLRDKDKSERVIYSEELGLGFDVASPDATYIYPGILKTAMLEEKQQRFITEEICLLYVAMSRAATKLYLCGQVKVEEGERTFSKNLPGLMQQAYAYGSAGLPAYILEEVRSYQDLIFLGLSAHPDPTVQAFLKEIGLLEDSGRSAASAATSYATGPDLAWTFRNYDDWHNYLQTLQHLALPQQNRPVELSEKSAVGRNEGIQIPLADFYRFDTTAYEAIPKLTVSELKRKSQIAGDTELEGEAVDVNIQLNEMIDLDTPEDSNSVSASDRGTAIHTVLRFLNPLAIRGLAREEALDALEKELNILTSLHFISEEERASITVFEDPLLRWANSELTEELIRIGADGDSDKIFREMPFTFRYENPDRSKALVQGVIDLWYRTEQGAHLVDYKSDRLPENSEKAREILLERYRLQLQIYVKALEETLRDQVNRVSIWAIRPAHLFTFSREDLGLE